MTRAIGRPGRNRECDARNETAGMRRRVDLGGSVTAPPRGGLAMGPKISTTRRRGKPVGEGYLALIRVFPLRPIRSEAELSQSIDVIDALSDREHLSTDQHDYLLVLSGLIEKYEDERYPIPAVSGVSMLRYLIESKGVSQARVAAEAGIAES